MSDIDTEVVDSLKCLTPTGRLEKRHYCSAQRSDAKGHVCGHALCARGKQIPSTRKTLKLE